MYEHILIATDGSEVGQKGLDHGLSLAKALNARVTVLTVTEPFPMVGGADFGYAPSAAALESVRSSQAESATALLAAAGQAAEQAGVQADVVHIADAPPADAIIEMAKSRSCDLITMGSHGRRGLGRLMLGSKAAEVVTHCHIPVLVVR